jgi:hypothetical protein
MTITELDQLLEDTRRVPRVEDRVGYNMTLAVIEIARQLMILNDKIGGTGQPMSATAKTKAAKK